jgi:glycosyltransferase involved in cell wall biosynthesis
VSGLRTSSSPCVGQRPRILFLTTELPWPASSGGTERTLETLRALATFCELRVLSFAEPDAKLGQRARALERAIGGGSSIDEPTVHRIRIRRRPVALARTLIRSLAAREPYLAAKFWNRTFATRVAAALASGSPDLVYVDHLNLIKYAGRTNVPVILDQHNVESALFAEAPRHAVPFWLRSALTVEAARVRQFEREALLRARLVLTISAEVTAALRALAPEAAIETIPLSAGAPATFRATPRRGEAVLFLGTLSWPPNLEAARWLVRRIWPHVHKLRPTLELWICGGTVAGLDSPEQRVRTLGFVPELEPIFDSSRLAILPILSGDGVCMKVLRVMKAGIPVVATPHALRGLHVRAGEHALVSEDPQELARAIVELHEDPGLRTRLVEAANAFLLRDHGRPRLEAAMRQAVARAIGGAA